MKALCIECKQHVGISIKKKIPKTGYVCHVCEYKKKRSTKTA